MPVSTESTKQRSKSIERNADKFSGYNNLLIFGPPESDDLSYLKPKKVITFDYRVFQSHEASLGDRIVYSCAQTESQIYDAVIIFVPKAKKELDLALAFLTPMLMKGASIYLVGEKKSGIESAAKRLNALGSNNSKLDSAKHCQLWQVSLEEDVSAFCLADWIETFKIEVNDIAMELVSIPGVFSFGQLDIGTELLLQNMFAKLDGRVLDFGCGSGVVGIYTKLLNPSIQLEMVDINILAIECAKRSCELNSIEATVYPSDGWKDVKGRVNGVVSNPPFHSGVTTEYRTTEGFIRGAKGKMSKHAPFLLVANSFLKYAQIIEATFERCDILAENRKFKVYKTFR
ncbi:MAG: 16S rRNA (guanine1207-N2)-methyltransferase [Pseudohongiellaceae bacterium]|jgi:16S rRNA (guanine1207-N2)-methyltransferase